jgi:DNA polymerase elongation subunit (family B)
MEGNPIRGQRALELTIILAQKAGELASAFLKAPHDLEYEKTFMPFCLLSKKRYVGMLYETDPHKCYRKSMGIVLKRRDNAPIVKDVYGGVIDTLMEGGGMQKAVEFTNGEIGKLVAKQVPIEKLLITKSLRSGYKNPKSIAHKVLADRIAERDPGNKIAPGSRIAFAYIVNPSGKSQGDKIETPEFIRKNKCKLDYSHYITNQIMKPVSQVLGLCVEDLPSFRTRRNAFVNQVETIRANNSDLEKARKLEQKLRDLEVKRLVFDKHINQAENLRRNQASLFDMWA